jgi:ABC-type transport system involved in multi-copper enzyme maturation permease subunit
MSGRSSILVQFITEDLPSLPTQFFALCRDGLLQARRSYILLILIALCTILLGITAFAIQIEKGDITNEAEIILTVPLLGLERPMRPETFAFYTMRGTLQLIIRIGIFFFIFAFSGFIPESLAKGTADLLLSKPIPRWLILIAKAFTIGALSFCISSYLFVGTALLVWFKSGFWPGEQFTAFFCSQLMFVPLLALMTFVNVFTRSTALTVVVTLFTYFVSGFASVFAPEFSFEPRWLAHTIEGIWWSTPRFVDMANSVTKMVNPTDMDFGPFWHAFAYSLIMFGVTLFTLNRKNYTV